MGFSPDFSPARDSLMADASCSIASSWPNTTILSFLSKSMSASLSDVETWAGGIRAIFATTCSTSLALMLFLRRLAGSNCWAAPASSITSIALSGMKRSVMYLSASSLAERSALSVKRI